MHSYLYKYTAVVCQLCIFKIASVLHIFFFLFFFAFYAIFEKTTIILCPFLLEQPCNLYSEMYTNIQIRSAHTHKHTAHVPVYAFCIISTVNFSKRPTYTNTERVCSCMRLYIWHECKNILYNIFLWNGINMDYERADTMCPYSFDHSYVYMLAPLCSVCLPVCVCERASVRCLSRSTRSIHVTSFSSSCSFSKCTLSQARTRFKVVHRTVLHFNV